MPPSHLPHFSLNYWCLLLRYISDVLHVTFGLFPLVVVSVVFFGTVLMSSGISSLQFFSFLEYLPLLSSYIFLLLTPFVFVPLSIVTLLYLSCASYRFWIAPLGCSVSCFLWCSLNVLRRQSPSILLFPWTSPFFSFLFLLLTSLRLVFCLLDILQFVTLHVLIKLQISRFHYS